MAKTPTLTGRTIREAADNTRALNLKQTTDFHKLKRHLIDRDLIAAMHLIVDMEQRHQHTETHLQTIINITAAHTKVGRYPRK